MLQLKGIIPAIITPMKDDGSVNHEVFADLLEYHLKIGATGFVVLGSTGEYYALSNEERRAVMKTAKEVVGNRGMLMTGANGSSTREVIEQVQQAVDCGYNNLLIAAPYYCLPSQAELLSHYQAILAAFPQITLTLYNYPVRTNTVVGMEIVEAFKDHPQVIAIKESSGELLRAIEIGEKYQGKIQLSCGSDDQALDFFLWGASSWICGPANAFGPQANELYNKFNAGDIRGAQAVMRRLFPVMANLESGKFIQKVKYGTELAGFKPGPARAPLLPLTDEEKVEFRKIFEAAQ